MNYFQEKVEIISDILGRPYKTIRLIEHALFTNNKASTVILESHSLNYSEALQEVESCSNYSRKSNC